MITPLPPSWLTMYQRRPLPGMQPSVTWCPGTRADILAYPGDSLRHIVSAWNARRERQANASTSRLERHQ